MENYCLNENPLRTMPMMPLPYRPPLLRAVDAARAVRDGLNAQIQAQNTLVERVARLLHALGGHLHGEYPMHAVARGDPGAVDVVDCTLPLSTLRYAASVLASEMDVTVLPDASESSVYRFHGGRVLVQARPGFMQGPAQQPLTVTLRGHGMLAEPPMFDFHLLSSASSRLYVTKTPIGGGGGGGSASPWRGDRLMLALSRVRAGVFSLLPRPPWIVSGDSDSQGRVLADYHARAMTSAARLVVERGWRMDDSADGRRSWVVARWDSLWSARASPGDVQTSHQSSCPICHEAFAQSDAVVNLPCNHNFHAVCVGRQNEPDAEGMNRTPDPNREGKSTSGLCAWLAGGHLSCPMCRTSISTNQS